MPKISTAIKFLRRGHLRKPANAIRLDLRNTGRLGEYKQPLDPRSWTQRVQRQLNIAPDYNTVSTNVNVRSLLHLMRLLDELGMSIFTDLGPHNLDFWWRTRFMFRHQHWAPWLFRDYSLVVADGAVTTPTAPRQWTVHYTAEPFAPLDDLDVAVPYGMNPLLCHVRGTSPLPRDVVRRRPIRILFAGRCTEEGYHQPDILWQRYGKLTRFSLIQHLRANRMVREPRTYADFQGLLQRDDCHEFVLLDTSRFSIPTGQWLEVLASAEFFFCPPGLIMPMCHNLIESLAVGTIPITSYPEWLTPHLRHGETCLSFSTNESLDAALAAAHAMPAADLARMRRSAVDYFDNYLNYSVVAGRLARRLHEPLRLHVLDESLHRVEALPIVRPPFGEPTAT